MTVKQLVRIGVFYIEEALLTTLLQEYPEYMRAADLSRIIGIKTWDNDDWVIDKILTKMGNDGRVEPRTVTLSNGRTRREGWKLTETEYNRLDGEETLNE